MKIAQNPRVAGVFHIVVERYYLFTFGFMQLPIISRYAVFRTNALLHSVLYSSSNIKGYSKRNILGISYSYCSFDNVYVL